jgi:hypothetical protein
MCATFSRHLQRSGAMCVKCLWSEHAALMTFEENDAAASSGTGKVECFQVHAVAEHNALTHPRSWPCALDMTHTPSRLCRSTQCTARPSVRSSTGKLDTRVAAKRASVHVLARVEEARKAAALAAALFDEDDSADDSDEDGSSCIICLDTKPKPIQSGCGCRCWPGARGVQGRGCSPPTQDDGRHDVRWIQQLCDVQASVHRSHASQARRGVVEHGARRT